MNKLIIPKELNPKTKLSFINLKNIAYSLPIIGVPYYLKTTFSLEGVFINISIFICIIFSIYSLFDDKKYGNKSELLLKSLSYLTEYHKKNNQLYVRRALKNIKVMDKKGKEKIIKKTVYLNDSEIIEKIYEKNDIEIIDFDDIYGVGWYIKTSKKYLTFLSLEIDLLPSKELNDNSKLTSIESFENILMSQDTCTLKVLSKSNDLEEYKKEIDLIDHNQTTKEKQKYKFFIDLKRSQLKNAESIPCKKYILKIEGKNLSELDSLIHSIKGEYNFSNTKLLNEEDFKEYLYYSIDSNINVKYYADYVHNEMVDLNAKNKSIDLYERFILVKSLGTEQDPYFLRTLANYNYDFQIKLKKVYNHKTQINKAHSEITSRAKYDNTLTGGVELIASSSEITNLYYNLHSRNKCLFNMEIIIKIDGYTLEELNKNTDMFLKDYLIKNDIEIFEGFFMQDSYAKSFYEIDNKMFHTGYIISSSNVAGGYPFNYSKLLQKGGILHNASNTSILALNYHLVDSSNNQSSYNFIIAGGMGWGKSSLLKEMSIEEIVMKQAKVIMYDFDNETIGLVDKLEGNMIIPSITNINLLEVLVDPNKTKEKNIATHITDLKAFFNIVYPNWNDKIISLFTSSLTNITTLVQIIH